jgi:uncharacterized protein YjbJ (UPF0337 family)
MNRDSKIIFESYQRQVDEGMFDRMKARGRGLAQSIGGLKNTASNLAGKAKGAVGTMVGNQNMVQQGAQQVQQAQQQSAARTTGKDTKATAINTTFTGKIDKELMNFNNRLSKTLGVTDPQQLLSTLEQSSPDMAKLYSTIQEISNQIKQSTGGSPQPAPGAPAPGAPAPGAPAPGAPAPGAGAAGDKVTVQTKNGPQTATLTGAGSAPGFQQVKLDSGTIFAAADSAIQPA